MDENDIDLDKIKITVIPDYPDWKRGLKFGLFCGIPLSLSGFIIPVSSNINQSGFLHIFISKLFFVAVIFIMMFVFFGAIGAFRPQKYRK